MVVPGWSRSLLAARVAASKVSGWLSHQFITRNRRVAVGLALVTVFKITTPGKITLSFVR